MTGIETAVRRTPGTEASVLIAGGGLNGTATAVFLAHYGVRCVLVERRQEIPPTSRTQRLNPRTMEILRTVGLDDDVRRAGFDPDELGDMIQFDTLAGEEIGRQPQPWVAVPPGIGPVQACCCNHSWFLGRLRAAAAQLGVDVYPAVELTDLTADPDGVNATLAGMGTVRASYLVGADGPHSLVRERAGIAAKGPGTVANQHIVLFHADLEPVLRGRHSAAIQLARVGATLLKESGTDSWALVRTVPSDDPIELIRAAVGLRDLDVTIAGTLIRPITLLSADRFGSGRVLLVGDAAHSMPDTPGLHGDTTVQDAQNLAWKLAAVLSGMAGVALLDTYEAERRPLAELALADAFARIRGGPAPADMPERLAFELGWVYRSSAVVPQDGSDGPVFVDPRTAAGLPGMRAPHCDNDLFGHGFVLVTRERSWLDAATAVAGRLDVPIAAHRVSEAATQADYATIGQDAVLVRPDGVVGWRSAAPAGSEEPELEDALRRMLSIGAGQQLARL